MTFYMKESMPSIHKTDRITVKEATNLTHFHNKEFQNKTYRIICLAYCQNKERKKRKALVLLFSNRQISLLNI